MTFSKYLLIGGGLACGQAAKQLRTQDPQGGITLVSEEPHLPYDRPPLSKEFLRGQKPRTQLFFDPEPAFRDRNISLILGIAAKQLEAKTKTVTLADGRTVKFEKALLATGGRPVRLTLPGGDLPGVHYLRTIENAEAIAEEAGQGKRAVIIGAGFIGLEVAASLTQLGAQVTVLEAQPRIWPRFADPALAEYFQRYCSGKGITFLTGETATEFRGKGRVSSVTTKSGKTLPCDLVCIGIGITPNVELGHEAGLAVENGIVVNEYLQTSHPDIYAAGDVANYLDPLFGKRRRVEHWGHAEYTGQMAADNMTGSHTAYDLLTYVWSDLFDLHLEFAGDETEHDRILLRGRMEDNKFFVLYLKNQVLHGYVAVNTGAKEFPALQRLIRQKKNLNGKDSQLQDPAVAVKTLA